MSSGPGGFGQVVLGPPGSGKTTYCRGMKEFLSSLGRNVKIVNLDPANEGIPYHCSANIADLITLEDAMESFDLGPNGGMIYCLEFLEKNVDWLVEALENSMAETLDEKEEKNNEKQSPENTPYFLFDLPGQVELFTHHESLRNIIEAIQRRLDLRLSAVHLVDSYHCSDPSKFISVLFLSLSTMLRLELPHVNVLSKVDLMESKGTLHFNLDFYKDAMELEHLIPLLPSNIALQAYEGPTDSVQETASKAVAAASTSTSDEKADSSHVEENADKFNEKFRDLNRAICNIVEEYSLVSFHTLNIEDKESVFRLIKAVDKTNGYIQAKDIAIDEWITETTTETQEKYLKEMFSK